MVLGSEVSSDLDERGEVRDLRHQVGAEIHDLLKEELALLVNLRALLGASCQLDQRLVDSAVVECLEQQRNVVVKQVLIEVDDVGTEANTAASHGVEVTTRYVDGNVKDVHEGIKDRQLFVHVDGLGE